MKKIIFLLLTALVVLTGCVEVSTQQKSDGSEQNALLPEKLIVNYYTPIQQDSIYTYNVSTFTDTGINLVNLVFDKVLKGDIPVYEIADLSEVNCMDSATKLNLIDVKNKLGMVEETITYENEAGVEVSKAIASNFYPEQIVEIGFKEEWVLNGDNFKLTKNVFSYEFVREYYKSEDTKRKALLFSIYPKFEEQDKPKWEFIGTKASETYIAARKMSEMAAVNNQQNEVYESGKSIFNDRNPFWNYFAYHTLVSNLFEAAKNEAIVMLDFETNDTLKYADVENRMGASEMHVSYMNENGDEVTQTIKNDLVPEEVRSLIFIEDWYLDKTSMAIKKEIKGIAPVRFYSIEKGVVIREIVFLAKFD